MAKKKTRILWLSKDTGYELREKEPIWDKDQEWWRPPRLYSFCGDLFQEVFPALELRKNTKCKLKLTQLKNGIKLEKVK